MFWLFPKKESIRGKSSNLHVGVIYHSGCLKFLNVSFPSSKVSHIINSAFLTKNIFQSFFQLLDCRHVIFDSTSQLHVRRSDSACRAEFLGKEVGLRLPLGRCRSGEESTAGCWSPMCV